MENSRIAVFDIDGTLIANNIGITFVKYLNSRGMIRPLPKIVVSMGYVLYKAKIVGFEMAIRLGNFALAGLDVAQVSTLASKCFESEIKPKIFSSALDEIQARKQEGYTVILATGAHEAIAIPFARYVNADFAVSTKSVVENNKYGWSAEGQIPYKTRKRDLVQAAIARLGLPRPDITVYTDEEKDLALLDIADHCVAVNADAVIRQAVLNRHGRVVEFK